MIKYLFERLYCLYRPALRLMAIVCFLYTNQVSANSIMGSNMANGKSFHLRENKGQVHDQYFQSRQDILYSGVSGNLGFYLKNDGLHYQLSKVESWKKDKYSTVSEIENRQLIPDKVSVYRVDVNWKGANKNASIEKGEALSGYENFYNVPKGIEPALAVKSYAAITYKNIYKDIDLKFYESKSGGLEYDFIVQPNADYRQIVLEINGAALSVNEMQELIIKTPFGNIVEGALAIYQEERKIAGRWLVEGQTVRFAITENYDKTKPLRIDPPVRVWGTYAGTKLFDNTSFDVGASCSTDPTGNVFMAGTIEYGLGSTLLSNIVSTGAHQTTFQSTKTAFLMKFNDSGLRQWGTFYGGNGEESGNSCAADANGNVFLTGETSSTNNIATAGSHQINKDISDDAYLVKFNAAGVRQWGTYFGKDYGEVGRSVAVDNIGNVYLSGTGGPSVNFGTAGTHQQTGAGGTDAFLAKFNTNGTRLWCTFFGGPLQDEASGCTVDLNGNVYITGWTSSTSGIASSGASQITFGGGQRDIFLAKFNSLGVRQWSTYLGGPATDDQSERDDKPSVDANENVYISGQTQSITGIATLGAHQTSIGGLRDALLAKWDAAGTLQWATYYGGSGQDYGVSSSLDATGNVYFVGQTFSANGIVTAGAHQTTGASTNSGEAYLVKFSPNGQRDWGTYYGGSGNDDKAWNLTIHKPTGAIYICGQTNSINSIATSGAHQTTYAGGYTDAYLAKFIDCPPAGTILPTTNAPICAGQNLTLTVPSISGAIYTWSGPNGFTSSLPNPTLNSAGVNASGTYNVTVTANGCPGSTGSVIATITTAPTVTASSNSPVCPTKPLNLSVSSLPNATYTWVGPNGFSSSLQNPTIVAPLAVNAGVYSVSVTSAGCVSTSAVTVIVNPVPSVVPGSNSPLCVGQTLNLTAANLPNVSYSWTGPNGFSSSQQNPTISNVSLAENGSYTLLLTDANGCTNNPDVKVTITSTPVAPTVSGTSICAGQTATLSVTAPNAANFVWFTVATGGTAIFTGSSFTTPTLNSNTTYYVESQSGSCVSSRTVVIVTVNPSPAAPIASSLTPGVCSDSVAVFQVTSVDTTFNWYATNTSTTILGTGTTFTSPPLTASASYFVEHVENGCPSTRTQVFTQVIVAPDPMPANTQICAGVTTTLNSNLANGNTVNWYLVSSGGSAIATGITFTTPILNLDTVYYAQTFTNGCPSTRVAYTITVNTPPAIPTVNDTTICSGQSATLFATSPSGATLNWYSVSTGGVSIGTGATFTTPILSTGTSYFIESMVTGCPPSARKQVNVLVNTTPASPSVNDTIICNGEAASLIASAISGVTFEWFTVANGGTRVYIGSNYTTPILTNSTNYFVAATAGNCSSTRRMVTVTVNNPPAAPQLNNVVICEGDSAVFVAPTISGIVYNWFDAPTSGVALQSGNTFTSPNLISTTNYFIEAFNGCTSSRTLVTATVNSPPLSPTSNDTTICSGQSVTLIATAPSGVAFSWFSVLTGGNSIGAGSTFTTPVLSSSASYFVESIVNGCPPSARKLVSVFVSPTPYIPLASDVSICSGDSATLSATSTPRSVINWYTSAAGGSSLFTGPIFVSPKLTSATSYFAQASLGVCLSPMKEVKISVNQLPASPTVANATICTGNTATLMATAPNGVTFNWFATNTGGVSLFSGNSFTSDPLGVTTDFYVESQINGCPPSARTLVSVSVLARPQSPSIADTTVCLDERATLTIIPTSNESFNWYNVPSGGLPFYTGNQYTTPSLQTSELYYVEAVIGNCPSSLRAVVSVDVLPIPAASFSVNPDGLNPVMLSKANFTFNNSTINGVNYVWYFGDGDSLVTSSNIAVNHQYKNTGNYLVTLCATSGAGCRDCFTYGKIVVVEDYAVYIPNAFSPNGDGNNDVFEYQLIGVSKASIRIFNRWGEKVYETEKTKDFWNGSYKGESCSPGIYIYDITLMNYSGKQERVKGSLTLIR